MLTRFLIVILAILNVGVALWWMMPRTEPAPVPAKPEPGVATLEVLPTPAPAVAAQPDAAPAAGVAPTPAPPAPAATPAAEPALTPVEQKPATPVETKPAEAVAAAVAKPAPEQCLSLGPFADRAKADAARTALGSDALRPRVREVAGGKPATSYRVVIPPAVSREEAQATVKRIAEAGISDYFIISQGDDANAIALGQYRSREGAERRLAAVTAAGFPARLTDNGSGEEASWWLDLATTGAPATLTRRAGAARQQSLDCARLR